MHGAHLHVTTAAIYLYLSHLLNAVGEDVRNDNPLLRRRPQVHLDQNDVVEQHQVAHVCHLHKKTAAEENQPTEMYGYMLMCICVCLCRYLGLCRH